MDRPLLTRIRHGIGSPAAAFVGPFLVFMVLLEAVGWFRIDNSHLPWWRQFPEHWIYPLQAVLCLGLVVAWRRRYPPWRWRGMGLGVAAGVAGIGVWLLPPVLHAWTGMGGEESWLAHLGFAPRREGFDPYLFGDGLAEWPVLATVALRLLRLVVTVSLVEEIFWRGFLMRWISGGESPWTERRLDRCDARSVLLTAGAFALAHAGPDAAVAFLFGLLAGWVSVRTGNLWAVVVLHATANACLGGFILATGWWGLW